MKKLCKLFVGFSLPIIIIGVIIYQEFAPWAPCSTKKLCWITNDADRYPTLQVQYQKTLSDGVMTNKEYWELENAACLLSIEEKTSKWEKSKIPAMNISVVSNCLVISYNDTNNYGYHEVRRNIVGFPKVGSAYYRKGFYYVNSSDSNNPYDYYTKTLSLADSVQYILERNK